MKHDDDDLEPRASLLLLKWAAGFVVVGFALLFAFWLEAVLT